MTLTSWLGLIDAGIVLSHSDPLDEKCPHTCMSKFMFTSHSLTTPTPINSFSIVSQDPLFYAQETKKQNQIHRRSRQKWSPPTHTPKSNWHCADGDRWTAAADDENRLISRR